MSHTLLRAHEGYSEVHSNTSRGDVDTVNPEASLLLDPVVRHDCDNHNDHNCRINRCVMIRSSDTKDGCQWNQTMLHVSWRTLICVILWIAILVILFIVKSSDGEPIHFVSHRVNSDPSMATCASQQPDPTLRLKQQSTLEGIQHGAVASDHPLCSEIGKSILEIKGGNAVDAAIATALCLGVSNPASSGIGGGMFMVIHADREHHLTRWESLEDSSTIVGRLADFVDARKSTVADRFVDDTKMTEVIDAREVAPQQAHRDMFLEPQLPPTASVKGGLAIAVLGELRGLDLAHARHGSLDWSIVLEPAIRLAREGVVVTNHLATDIAGQQNNIVKFGLTGLGRLLSRDGLGKTMLKEGDILKNPTLAATLEAVSQQGADALYKGERAKSLAAEIRAAGGIITEADLNQYKATLRSPLISDCSGFSFVGVPPPSSGGATIIGILRFLSGFESPVAFMADTLSVHRLVEAMRHAFAIRMSLSDPDFSANVSLDAANDLIQGDYMDELRLLHRDNQTAPLSVYGGSKWAQLNDTEGSVHVKDAKEGDRQRRLRNAERRMYRIFGNLEDHGTTHISVIDSQGNAVSMTSTVNTYFGSGIVSESTGIVLNNQMDDFSTPGKANYFGLKPSEANFIEPYKKPLSSMAPMLIFKRNEDIEGNTLGDLFMAIGASGGPKIITSVSQVFINHALLGMPLFDAMSHPRIHDQLLYHGSDVTCYESSDIQATGTHLEVSNRTKDALVQRSHELLSIDYTGVVQAVTIDLETKTMSAVSDVRKGGRPSGY